MMTQSQRWGSDMEQILLSTEYVVVVDTNSPSFEFAEDFCAYCTGFESENSKDFFMVEKFYESLRINSNLSSREKMENNPFYDYVTDKMNQDGFYSPCTIWLNKKYGCNAMGEYAILTEDNFDNFSMPAPLSVGIYFEKEPTEEQLNIIKERAISFFKTEWKKPVEVEGMRIITKTLYGQEKSIW